MDMLFKDSFANVILNVSTLVRSIKGLGFGVVEGWFMGTSDILHVHMNRATHTYIACVSVCLFVITCVYVVSDKTHTRHFGPLLACVVKMR